MLEWSEVEKEVLKLVLVQEVKLFFLYDGDYNILKGHKVMMTMCHYNNIIIKICLHGCPWIQVNIRISYLNTILFETD